MVISDATNVTTTPRRSPKQVQVLLCGCGNAVHTLLAYMAQQFSSEYDFKINVLSTHADNLIESLPEDGRIKCISDEGTVMFGKANVISSDAAKVDVPGCSVILFALPTNRHEVYLKSMKPYIQEGTMIGSMH